MIESRFSILDSTEYSKRAWGGIRMARSSPHDTARSYFSAWIAVSWHKLEMRPGAAIAK